MNIDKEAKIQPINCGERQQDTGWHVPSDSEWQILMACLGGDSITGGKMKEAGTTHWLSRNTGAENENGFTALPDGYRVINANFLGLGYLAYFWSSTEDDTVGSWSRSMDYDNSEIYRYYLHKQDGFSIRLLRD